MKQVKHMAMARTSVKENSMPINQHSKRAKQLFSTPKANNTYASDNSDSFSMDTFVLSQDLNDSFQKSCN